MLRSCPILVSLALAVGVAMPALAQEDAGNAPVTDPAVRAALGLPRMTQDAEPLDPVRADELESVQPGLTGGENWLEGLALRQTELPVPARLPEGILFRGKIGTIWSGPQNLWIFLPDPADRGPGEGAMILAPNGVLDRLTSSLESQPLPASASVSGQTLLYHDHNYLLLTDYTRRRDGEVPEADAPPTAPSAADAPSSEPTQAPPPEEIEDLIADLQNDSRAGVRRSDALRERLLAAERSGGPAPDAEPVGTPPLLPDGASISQRRARLDRTSGGEWQLTFDNDADTLGDAPLVVIPGRTLMRMEARAGTARSMTMIVSGRVYTSRGRGYILPTIFTVEPPSDVNPLQ